jgi:hypothetical protein
VRANVSNANVALADAGISPPQTPTQVTPPQSHNLAQEAGELLANAAARWASEDIQAACAANDSDAEAPLIALLDEVHRLRLQLCMQHARVIGSYAEGIKSFSTQRRETANAHVQCEQRLK